MANRYDTNLILDRIADALDDDQNSALIDALTTIANAISQSGGGDIPSGGTMGQLLGKRSNQDFDVMWYDNLGDDALSNQASEYNPQSNYVVGDYCLHTNYLYVCISPTTGNWDSTCWNRVQFGEQISALNSKKLQHIDSDWIELQTLTWAARTGCWTTSKTLQSIFGTTGIESVQVVAYTGVPCMVMLDGMSVVIVTWAGSAPNASIKIRGIKTKLG